MSLFTMHPRRDCRRGEMLADVDGEVSERLLATGAGKAEGPGGGLPCALRERPRPGSPLTLSFAEGTTGNGRSHTEGVPHSGTSETCWRAMAGSHSLDPRSLAAPGIPFVARLSGACQFPSTLCFSGKWESHLAICHWPCAMLALFNRFVKSDRLPRLRADLGFLSRAIWQ
jgi:hypothetical protein